MNHGMILGCLQAHPGWQGQGKDNNWISLKRSAGSHKIASFMRKEGWDIEVIDYWLAFTEEESQYTLTNYLNKHFEAKIYDK